MPRDKHFRRAVRARQRDTGERYTTARASLRPATRVYPNERWGRISAPDLDAAREYSDRIGSAAVVVVRGGRLAASWGASDEPLPVVSMRIAFLSALFGVHRIDVRQTLELLGIDDSVPPHLTDVQRTATIEHLLQSRSGIVHPAEFGSADPAELETPEPRPGEAFLYNNWDFHALGTILRKLTGRDVVDEIDARIAKPIGMEDFDASLAEVVHEGYSEHPCVHFAMSSRDLARFGLLYLRRGKWDGAQVIPRAWVRRSLTPHTPDNVHKPDWAFGYCWWVHGGHRLGGHRCFASLGGTGHAVFVVPDLDLVMVHRVHGWNGPTKWPDVWPLLDLVAGTRSPHDVEQATRSRTAVLGALRASGPRNLEFLDGLASWTVTGDARVMVEPRSYGTLPTVRIIASGPCELVQEFDAQPFRGSSLRLSANVRVGGVLFFGTAEHEHTEDEWGRDFLTCQVRQHAATLRIGVRLDGVGQAQVGEFALEPSPTW